MELIDNMPTCRLAVICTNVLLALVVTGLCLYFPQYLAFVVGRTKYYLLGQDDPEVSMAQSIQQIVASWMWDDPSAHLDSLKEL